MKVLIMTVAGVASRFQKSLGIADVLKCLYYEEKAEDCLLYRLMCNFKMYDKYIIVGGYRFETLKQVVEKGNCFDEFRDRLILVHNTEYERYGSGYSLYKGLDVAVGFEPDEIVFAEGDLYVDETTCRRIYENRKSIISVNQEPIYADKAVAMYLDEDRHVHYIYDTKHGVLKIDQPFTAVFNSGQIWKFSNLRRVKEVFHKLGDVQWQGTNLIFIEEYFSDLSESEYEIITFKDWINCNTVEDFRKTLGELNENDR